MRTMKTSIENSTDKAAGWFSRIELIPLGWKAEISGFGLLMGIYVHDIYIYIVSIYKYIYYLYIYSVCARCDAVVFGGLRSTVR